MFESDQHEFDEEYAEISHPAPPSPKASVAAAVAAPAAVAEPPVAEEPESEVVEEEPSEEMDDVPEFVDPAEKPPGPPEKKKINWVLIAGAVGVVLFLLLVVFTLKPKQNTAPPGDLGPGIVAASGLRGHLLTQWEGNAKTGKLQYKVQIEPMEDRWIEGFSKVTSNPPLPISVNVRLMDASGFALCGKEIDFPFDPQKAAALIPVMLADSGKKMTRADRLAAEQAARQSQVAEMQTAEASRERGKDLFQNQLNHDNQVTAVNAQGTLPCSPDQYSRANYWDFNTNFPTLEEQAALVDPKAAALARKAEEEKLHPKKRSSLPQQGFTIQGDDRVSAYDPLRGLLIAEAGKSFFVDKNFGRATATAWASKYVLIHYRCDQHGNCALTEAGGVAGLRARLNE